MSIECFQEEEKREIHYENTNTDSFNTKKSMFSEDKDFSSKKNINKIK